MMQTQVFNIVLPRELVRRADTAAKQELRNRSELIREALRLYLQDQTDWENLFAYGKTQAKKLKIISETQANAIINRERHAK